MDMVFGGPPPLASLFGKITARTRPGGLAGDVPFCASALESKWALPETLDAAEFAGPAREGLCSYVLSRSEDIDLK